MCKLDFSKAFDRIDPFYLIKVLSIRKFPPRWIEWIKNILMSNKVAVNVNGEVGSWIFV